MVIASKPRRIRFARPSPYASRSVSLITSVEISFDFRLSLSRTVCPYLSFLFVIFCTLVHAHGILEIPRSGFFSFSV